MATPLTILQHRDGGGVAALMGGHVNPVDPSSSKPCLKISALKSPILIFWFFHKAIRSELDGLFEHYHFLRAIYKHHINAEDEVYDVTPFVYEHPGGDDVILNATGRDAKEEFDFVGHSESATELMKTCQIGELDPSSLISQLKLPTQQQTTSPSNNQAKTSKYWIIPATILAIELATSLLYFPNK